MWGRVALQSLEKENQGFLMEMQPEAWRENAANTQPAEEITVSSPGFINQTSCVV